ncbi:MAG: cytochrome c oxidase assembly protein, partial [Gammaproteobacteria bacterium]
GVDTTRNVKVELVATLNGAMPWEFKALQDRVSMHPGEVRTVNFYAQNESRSRILGRAVSSVAPGEAAKYLTKMECFCFRDQALGSGEDRVMPVRFFVDPALPKHITTVTLSYTFFRAPDKETARLTRGPAGES